MQHRRCPNKEDYYRPISPLDTRSIKMVSHSKENPHQAEEEQEGFQKMNRVDFFTALQQVHDSIKCEGAQNSMSDYEQAPHGHTILIAGSQGKNNWNPKYRR